MGYSLKDLANEEVELENKRSDIKTFPFLLRKLSRIGIDPSFVTKRIVPKRIQNELINLKDEQPDLLLDEAASYLSSIYGWSVNDIWNDASLTLVEPTNLTFFKKGISSKRESNKGIYAICKLLARVTLKIYKKKRNYIST